jgi:hypothetical protein
MSWLAKLRGKDKDKTASTANNSPNGNDNDGKKAGGSTTSTSSSSATGSGSRAKKLPALTDGKAASTSQQQADGERRAKLVESLMSEYCAAAGATANESAAGGRLLQLTELAPQLDDTKHRYCNLCLVHRIPIYHPLCCVINLVLLIPKQSECAVTGILNNGSTTILNTIIRKRTIK